MKGNGSLELYHIRLRGILGELHLNSATRGSRHRVASSIHVNHPSALHGALTEFRLERQVIDAKPRLSDAACHLRPAHSIDVVHGARALLRGRFVLEVGTSAGYSTWTCTVSPSTKRQPCHDGRRAE